MADKIKGRIAFVTGSSRGIGQQIAIGLAEQGVNIFVHGRRRNNTDATLKMLGKYPVDTFSVEGDLSDNAHLKKITDYIKNKFGGIDILYNNAAIQGSYKKNIWDHDSQAWMETFQVNVYAIYYLCASFIPGMIRKGYGRIINLTSGIKDQPELLPYSVSKAAVDKLTQDIAVKLNGTGVRINCLDPGWLKTDMGGPNAWYPVDHVLPGALVPALIDDDGPNGEFFSAIELHGTKI